MTTQWSGWTLTNRRKLLSQLRTKGIVIAHEVVVCDHVTLSYPARDLPPAVDVMVVGVAANEKIQALVVEVNGERLRPGDGKQFHITLSRREGVADWESNLLLQNVRPTTIRRFRVPTRPTLRST